MRIPTLEQIRAEFRRDVQLQTWRGRGRKLQPQQAPVYEGRNRELQDYLADLAKANLVEHRKAVAHLRDAAAILARGREVRRILAQVMGLNKLPPRTPLKARTVRILQRDGYEIEHVIFESRPRVFVTANLYLPAGVARPVPAVTWLCGHSLNGKAYKNYQNGAVQLARKGLAVLIADPAGQGERDEYVDISTGRRTVDRACRMHAVAGEPTYLLGSNFGSYRLWDAMRGIDYLQSRPEINPKRIGACGGSGGGWESIWLTALDQRVYALASNVYMTTWHRRIESRAGDAEPDPEQDPFGICVSGVEAADLIIACFPRPVALGTTLRDIFPVDGTIECYNEARALYQRAGMVDRVSIAIGDDEHNLTPEIRHQNYRWMRRWLADDPSPDEQETPFTPEPDENTYCTKSGIVLCDLGGLTTAELNARYARELAQRRQARQRRRTWPADVPAMLRSLLQLPERQGVCAIAGQPHVVGNVTVRALTISIADGVGVDARLWLPGELGRQPPMVYLADLHVGGQPAIDRKCRQLAESGRVVLDLATCGRAGLRERYTDFVPLVETTLTYNAFLLGRQVLAMRVADVLWAARWLRRQAAVNGRAVTLHGVGYGALLSLLAGAMDRDIAGVVEEQPLTSLSSLAWNRCYDWPVSMIVPGILQKMDLEDIRASLAPRPLAIINPVNHLREGLSTSAAREEFAIVGRAYSSAHAANALSVKHAKS
jgi:dienelactone hydrolase